jgi:hypothetical protein
LADACTGRPCAEDWAGVTQVLDFDDTSQHLWELGRALHGQDEAASDQWVEPRRHQLRHGREKRVLAEIGGLKVPPGPAGEGCNAGRTILRPTPDA